MTISRHVSAVVFATTLCATGGVCAQTLYQTFTLPASVNTWQSYSLSLTASLPGMGGGVWRVAATPADIGSPAGAPATALQLQSVLGNLGALEFGGVLTNASNGNNPPTIYPGAFALDNPNLGGLAFEDFTLASSYPAWKTTVNRAPSFGVGWNSAGGNPGGYISASDSLTVPALLTFSAPSGFLGNKSAAYGSTLSFDFQDKNNVLQPTKFDYGVAILTAVPEPSTWLLMLGGGALFAARRRLQR